MESDVVTLCFPSRLEWIGKTVDFLVSRARLCGCAQDDRGDRLMVALHEALTNAVVHGNLEVSSQLKEQPGDAFARALAERSGDPSYAERTVTVQFAYDGKAASFTICDEGKGFDTKKYENPPDEDDPALLLSSGRGILMMRAFTDEVHFGKGGREVTMVLKSPRANERRAAQRHPTATTVRVLPVNSRGEVDWDQAWEALGRNVSAGGIGLVQSRPQTAKRVLVELVDQNGKPVYVPADVCQLTPLENGLFQIGCRFSKPDAAPSEALVPSAVAELLEKLEHQPAKRDERRQHTRHSYTAKIEVRSAGSDTPRSAFSRDLSRGGIAFITSFEVETGSTVRLTLPAPNDSTSSQEIVARIVRCQKVTAGVYDVGCQFV